MQDAQDAPLSKIHVKAPIGLSATASHTKGPSDRSQYQSSDEDIQRAVESFPLMISSGLMTTAATTLTSQPQQGHNAEERSEHSHGKLPGNFSANLTTKVFSQPHIQHRGPTNCESWIYLTPLTLSFLYTSNQILISVTS